MSIYPGGGGAVKCVIQNLGERGKILWGIARNPFPTNATALKVFFGLMTTNIKVN